MQDSIKSRKFHFYLMVCFFFAIGITMLYFGTFQAHAIDELKTNGTQVNGVIESRSATKAEASITYMDNKGVAHNLSAYVPDIDAKSVSVIYDADNPSRAILADASTPTLMMNITGVTVIIAGVALLAVGPNKYLSVKKNFKR